MIEILLSSTMASGQPFHKAVQAPFWTMPRNWLTAYGHFCNIMMRLPGT